MILKSSTLQANQYTQNELGCLADQYSAQGLFMWEVSSSHDALFVESILGWYFKGLSWLRSHIEYREEMARPIIDICYIFYTNASTPHWRRFWRYDHDKRRIVHMNPKFVSAKRKKCLDAYRSDVSLNIRVWQDEVLIRWELGPYETGRYLFVDPKTGFTITLPRSGHIPGTIDMIAKTEKNYMCYAAPEGWIACSTWSPLAPKPE